jgi:hypothetical protein
VKTLAWIFGVLLLLCVAIGVAITSPKSQTWMAQRAAAYLSDELDTKITIRSVNIEFFKRVNLQGIYAQDKHGDTLLYAEDFLITIDRFSYDNRYLSIESIKLSDSKIKLKKYAGEKGLSYRFITQYFKTGDTTSTPSAPWKVEVGGVELDNVIFAFIDTRDTMNDPGMDYENIRVEGISAMFYDIDPMGDSLSLRIRDLKGTERCGLALKDFSTRVTLSDSLARLDNLKFITAGSAIDGFISFYFNSSDDIADDFVHLVKMDGHFSSSVIEMGDIAYFAPELLGMKKKILLTGDIKGTVEHLKCKNVDIRFGERSRIAGNFSFNGLPNINETDMNFKIREAVTNKKDLEGIPVAPFDKGKHLEVDESIGKLGDMVFSGSFEGFLNDFVAHGKLRTDLGDLKLENLVMTRDNDSAEYAYVGDVRASHFNIGSYYDIPDLSYVTGDVSIDGVGLSKNSINAKINGNFSELVYRKYAYTGISITNGKFRRQVFDGDFDVDDPNVKMVFKGSVDNSGALPRMDFVAKIDSANLGNLGFLDPKHENILSADLNMNFKGDNIDNIDGTFRVNNLNYSKDGEKFKFNEFLLVAGPAGNNSRTVFLESDIVTVTLSGKFQLMELPHTASDMMSAYLPSYFPPDNPAEAKKHVAQDFTWNINFHNNTKPIQALVPKLEIGPNTSFRGKFNSTQHDFNTYFQSPYIVYNDVQYRGLEINANSKNGKDQLTLTGTMVELRLTDTISTKNIRLNCIAANDSLNTHLEWNNGGEKKNSADINAVVLFEGHRKLQVNFRKTEFNVNDSLWSVAPGNYVRLDTGRLTFHQLVFNSGDASIGLNGFVSRNPSDELKVNMKQFNIAYLNYFSVPRGITMKGYISSETGLSDLFATPIFTSNTTFKDFWINGQQLGDGVLDADWLKPKQAVYLKGYFTKGLISSETNLPINNIAFDGFYFPKAKENSLDINATMINIPLSTLQPLLKDFCSVMVGQIDGYAHITGTPAKPLINGKVDVNFRMVRVDYLGLALRSAVQPIYIEENSFRFDDFKVTDEYGDTAKIYGHLFHDNFSKFQFDMDFSFDHFMVLNTNEKMNEDYYGRVFATGYMNVFGFVDDIVHIDMSAETERINKGGQPILSEFNIPMSTSSDEVSSNDFITFESFEKTEESVIPINKKKGNSGLDIKMNIVATEDMIVKVIFDKTVGDELTAYGKGSLLLEVPPSGDLSIRGQYEVESGKYDFTMKNVVRIPFDLAKGGTISWNGDPYDAQIHMDAVYETTTSVEPFFPTDSTNQAYHRSYPVEVIMHLDNQLMNPEVSFDIELPTADQNIQETVKSYTQTDLERNKQVLSLMVLNSFITPTELRGDASGNPNYGNAGSTLLSNFVSGTLNNWLSQISTDFNMGVKYRPNDDLTTPDLKVFLSTQLFNNRITIDGNFGKVNPTSATSTTTGAANAQWVGDANVEYKVTDDGKVRLRAFNRANDNAVLTNSAPYTQGVGLSYKEEFETWEEYFKRKKSQKQPVQQPTPPPPAQNPPVSDSTKLN